MKKKVDANISTHKTLVQLFTKITIVVSSNFERERLELFLLSIALDLWCHANLSLTSSYSIIFNYFFLNNI